MSRKAKPLSLDEVGGRVVGVFGAFNSHCLVVLPMTAAVEMFAAPISASGLTEIVGAVERDLEAIREKHPELAESALAATALTLAFQLANPYNSATSKGQCAKVLLDALDKLRELAGAGEQQEDSIDVLAAKRADRLKAATA